MMEREDAPRAGDVAEETTGKWSVLVVEDESSIRETLRDFLKRRGHSVVVAGDGDQATELLEGERRFELVLTDLRFPRGDGVEVLRLAKSRHPAGYVVLMTGFASLESAIEAIRLEPSSTSSSRSR